MVEPRVLSLTASDGYVWQYRRYEADVPPHGEIVALHGIQSHGGWYEASSRWLAEQGWSVSFLDRRGAGLNQAARGDCPSFRRLLDDIAEYMKSLPRAPTVVMGISWGAKLAVALQKRHPKLCAGLVLIAPGIKPRVKLHLWQRLHVFWNRVTTPTRQFPVPLNEPELFTANPQRREFIANDPLALRMATARLLFGSARMDVYLRIARRRVRVPALVLLAGNDQIINNRKTRKFVKHFRGPVEVIVYPGAHHTLEFEPAGPVFLNDVGAWLKRLQLRLSRQSKD